MPIFITISYLEQFQPNYAKNIIPLLVMPCSLARPVYVYSAIMGFHIFMKDVFKSFGHSWTSKRCDQQWWRGKSQLIPSTVVMLQTLRRPSYNNFLQGFLWGCTLRCTPVIMIWIHETVIGFIFHDCMCFIWFKTFYNMFFSWELMRLVEICQKIIDCYFQGK